MGMSHEMDGMDIKPTNEDQLGMDDNQEMAGGHAGHKVATQQRPSAPDLGIEHAPGGHGPGAAMIARNPVSRLNEPGIGLENVDHRVLVYGDLIGAHPWPDDREPERDIELHLTGNMEKYM